MYNIPLRTDEIAMMGRILDLVSQPKEDDEDGAEALLDTNIKFNFLEQSQRAQDAYPTCPQIEIAWVSLALEGPSSSSIIIFILAIPQTASSHKTTNYCGNSVRKHSN